MTGLLLLLGFLALVGLGIPIAYAMGLSTVVALLVLDIPMSVFFTRTVASINSFSLLAIPFFILAGDLLTQGGISKRLIAFADSLVGWTRGGLAMVNVSASVLFAGVSGSAAADTVAVGGVMIPAMKREGYAPGFAAAVTAASSTIGPLIPPSVLLILYGGISGLSISALFLAGVLPGLVVAFLLLTTAWWIGRKQVAQKAAFSPSNVVRTFGRAFWGILLPAALVIGILAGAFTATEGGVIIVIYALIISKFVYRELAWEQLIPIMVRSSIMSGVLMLLVGMAAAFAWVLAFAQVPQLILDGLTGLSTNPTVVLLFIVGFLLVFGMFVETVSALIITVPVLFPLGAALGFDPLHFALVIVTTLLIGTVTPPLGILLYICAGIAGTSIGSAIRASLPFIVVLVAAAVLVALVPGLSTWLPQAMAR
jgi:tripartite ATP-independent transporter DctM subunit